MPQKTFEDLKESYMLRIKEPLDKMFFATKQELINFADQISAGVDFSQIPHLASVYQDFIVDWDMFVQDADHEEFQGLVVSEVHGWVYRNVIFLQSDPDAFENCWKEQYVRNQPKEKIIQSALAKPMLFSNEQHKILMQLVNDPYAYVSFATKPAEMAICLPIGKEIFKLRAAVVAGGGVDRELVANSVNIIYKILKDTLNLYHASPFYLVGEVDDLLLKLSHVLHVFNGSRITIDKFKGYAQEIQEELLSDPHAALELIDRMDEATFDHYLELYELVKLANSILDCAYPDLIHETMARLRSGAKGFIRDCMGLIYEFDDNNPSELLTKVYHLYYIYIRVFKEYYIEDSILTEQTYDNLELMSTHLKELKDLASVNNGDVKILATLDAQLLQSILAASNHIQLVCVALPIDLKTFLSMPALTLEYLLQDLSRLESLILLHRYYAIPIQELIQFDVNAISLFINKPSAAVDYFNAKSSGLNFSALQEVLKEYYKDQAYTLEKFTSTQSVIYLGELFDNIKKITANIIAAGVSFVQHRAILERCVAQVFQFNGIYLDAYRNDTAKKEIELKLDRTAICARFDLAQAKNINVILDCIHFEMQKVLDLRALEAKEDSTHQSEYTVENLLENPRAISCAELLFVRNCHDLDARLKEKFFDAVNNVTNTNSWFSSLYTAYGEDLITKTIYAGNANRFREMLAKPDVDAIGYNHKMYSFLACVLYSENQSMINHLINSIKHKTENALRAYINSKRILVDIENIANNINSPLILNAAIKEGRLDLVEALLVRGVSPTVGDQNGMIPIHVAQQGKDEIHAVILNDLLICAELRVPQLENPMPKVAKLTHYKATF